MNVANLRPFSRPVAEKYRYTFHSICVNAELELKWPGDHHLDT